MVYNHLLGGKDLCMYLVVHVERENKIHMWHQQLDRLILKGGEAVPEVS